LVVAFVIFCSSAAVFAFRFFPFGIIRFIVAFFVASFFIFLDGNGDGDAGRFISQRL
jgi:hypothetical protein